VKAKQPRILGSTGANMTTVCLIKVQEYNKQKIANGLRLAWQKQNYAALFGSSEKILLKPNMLSAVTPDLAVTTNPVVFGALAEVLADQNINPHLLLSYGDSPAHESMAKAARITGLEAMANDYGLISADFDNGVEVQFPADSFIKHLNIANGVLAADGIVSVSKFKTHALTGITGAVKNQYGVIPGLKKARFHAVYSDVRAFARMLVELNRYLKPRLYVMDAVTIMEGNGPRNGTPRSAGYVLVGTDPVAVDTVMAAITGHNTNKMPLFQLFKQTGFGEVDQEKIDLIVIDTNSSSENEGAIKEGALPQLLPELEIEDFVQAKTEKSWMTSATRISGNFSRRFILQRPVIDAKTCIRCGQCVTSCPLEPKALHQENRDVPKYRYDLCIRCFCCQEICPAAAISVRKPWQSSR
jgi:uncharacterized protein (DUF362 family)/Pyruvate/2-oxoacid:ferredoxin oxidoreductase delta subunit